MTDVDISCLCGRIQCKLTLADVLPTALNLCHRSSCRYNLGALCHAALTVKEPPKNIELLQRFDCQGIFRYFCPVCGSHVFEQDSGWKVQSGVVTSVHSEQVFGCFDKIASHRYVEETGDGGLSVCLSGADTSTAAEGSLAARNSPQTVGSENVQSLETNEIDEANNLSTRLRASCACGGVQFFITRPNAASARCSSPWPDLIVPYSTGSSNNPDDVKWWIRDNGKWLAGTCACKSCRVALGSPIQSWAFVSLASLEATDGTPLTYHTGTLTAFESSKGAIREFCRVCGAKVFWHSSERPGVVDVSVGVLRAPEGVLAREWLCWWTDRVSFEEEALEKKLIADLQSGLTALTHV